MNAINKAVPMKDSGISWIGEIPKHWKSNVKLQSLTRLERGSFVNGPFGSDLLVSELTTEGVPVIYIRDINALGYQRKSDSFVSPTKARQLDIFRVDPGDVIIAKVGDPPGDSCVYPNSETPGIVTQDVIRLKLKPEYDSKYVAFLINSGLGKSLIGAISIASTRERISLGDFKNLRIACPPAEEQKTIAQFLDRKTAAIDALIAKKQRLIELLEEKRSALINQAVTKGLNPDAPMKDSGIPWIGDVPKHWEVKRLKFISYIRGRIGFRGYTFQDQVEEGEGALVLGATQIHKNGSLDFAEKVFLSWKKYYESPEIIVKKGDILVVQRGSTCGKIGFVKENIGSVTINPSLILISINKVDSEYISYFVTCNYSRAYFDSFISSTAIPMLTQEEIGELQVLIPPNNEQRKIVNFLENLLRKNSNSKKAIEDQIKLLQEYRQSVITAAVTGKLDVTQAATP